MARDGKNVENMQERMNKVKRTVRAIITCGKSDIMKKMETNVLVKLHNTVTIPTILANSETWHLNEQERKEVDKMELWAWKTILGLPLTTPTPSVIYATGSLFASIRVDIRQLMYFQKLLKKPSDHWAREALHLLKDYEIGWAKRIKKLLET